MTGITMEQLEAQKEVLSHLCEVYKKNREAVPIEELRTRYAKSFSKLCSSLDSELMIYCCMYIRLATYIDETDEKGLNLIRYANTYVIDNWRDLLKKAKKNELDALDQKLDEYRTNFLEKAYYQYITLNMEV